MANEGSNINREPNFTTDWQEAPEPVEKVKPVKQDRHLRGLPDRTIPTPAPQPKK